MMEELIQQLLDKAGLTPEQAEKAAETFIAFVKSKVPPALHGNIDSILGGGSGGSGTGFLGGLVNKAKDFLD